MSGRSASSRRREFLRLGAGALILGGRSSARAEAGQAVPHPRRVERAVQLRMEPAVALRRREADESRYASTLVSYSKGLPDFAAIPTAGGLRLV
jgi:hypothetical protein